MPRKYLQTPFPLDWFPTPLSGSPLIETSDSEIRAKYFDLLRFKDELVKENEGLRRQVDAARKLSTEAWGLVTRLSRPLTDEEMSKHQLWGCYADFIELMEERKVYRA